MANYITNDEFLSLRASLKDKDAEIRRLQKIEDAAKKIIQYQLSGSTEDFINWESLFGELEKSIRTSI